jgi:streptogramin lyase/phosphodiesterase/alkaline phosphatase D-like protein
VSDFTFGSPGSGEGQLSEPGGLGEDEAGNLWVADTGNSRLEKFSPDGAFISTFGKHGSGHGEFLTVNDVATLNGSVWAVDAGRDQLLSFSPKGQWEWERGSTGSGNGQFESPMGITVYGGAFGIWASDYALHRVQEFNEKGEYIRTITGGSGNGPALEGPVGVQYEIVGAGNLWVVDSTAGRVLAYSSSGYYQGSVGENGTGAGQLHHPTRVAILPSGSLVVADGDAGGKNSRIQVFSPSGEFLGTVAGSQGPTFGDVLYSGGYLYATEAGEGASRVRRWHFPQAKVMSQGFESVRAEKAILTGAVDPWGTQASYHFEYGATKAYGSKLPVPDSALGSETGVQEAEQEITGLLPATTYHYRLVAVNSSGASYGKDMTFKTASAKAPSVITESPSGVSASQATFKGTVNPNGAATTYRFEYADAAHWAVNHFGSAQRIPVPDKGIGSGASPVAVSQTVTNLQPHTLYHVRLKAINAEGTVDGEHRTFTTPRTFSPPTYSSSFGSKGTGDGQFTNPYDLTADPSGNVWVSDTGNNRIQKLNSKGEYQCKIGAVGSGNGQFSSPRGIAADPGGDAWVADYGNSRIQEISSSCAYLSQFGKFGSANGELQNPLDVAVDAAGNVWVADTGNRRIQKFTSKGEYQCKIGTSGTGDGQFSEGPLSIAIDIDGNAWAGDKAGRMQKFSPKCEFLAKFDQASSGAPGSLSPASLAIDPSGNLWIPSVGSHNVSGFFPEGEYVMSFGEEGTGAGQFTEPTAIAAGTDGTLWVIDHSGTAERIEKWVPGAPYPVVTGQAKSLKRTEATLTGSVNPQGKATSYRFEYGTTAAFGSSIPASPKSAGSGSSPVAVSEFLDGLKAGTTYYYHLLATSGESTTYGETRHFTTLAKPGPNAKWRIGGQTFAEAGLEKASVGLEGKLKIEISIASTTIKINCDEYGAGTLTPSGISQEKLQLYNCTWIGAEETCKIKKSPVEYTVNGSYEATVGYIWLQFVETCGFFENYAELAKPSGYFEYGTEGKFLNVNAYATASLFGGSNPVTITSNSHWFLSGEQIGKTLGVEEGPPEVFSEAATGITDVKATMNGTVNPLGLGSTYRFEYGPTTSYGSSAPLNGASAGAGTTAIKESATLTELKPATTYHYRISATSNGGTSYGKDKTFTTMPVLNSHWRIQGSTPTELGVLEPYESTGKFTVETKVLGIQIRVDCTESGSGTLGLQETMNLSACETKLDGKTSSSCPTTATPIKLDSNFLVEGTNVTSLKMGEKCPPGEIIPVRAGPGFTMKTGTEAVEFAANLSEDTWVLNNTPEHAAHVTITSTWKLTGKYKGAKFGYQ